MGRRQVVVTGATGRVAAQLIPALEERYELRLIDRTGDDQSGNGAPLVIGELTDHRVLDEVLAGADAVVHLAGNPDPAASWEDLREPNVEGFVALLASARRHGVRRVVFASSVHAMGAYEGSRRWPVDPAWPPAPCCAYGATKAFDEALARAYSYQSSMSLIGLRLGLCTPDASPIEAVAGWLGSRDLQRVVLGALETEVSFGVYHAVSWPSRDRWNIETTVRELRYEPQGATGRGGEQFPEYGSDGHFSTCTPPQARSSEPARMP